MDASVLHAYVGWIAMLLGVATGSVMGLFFHREEWAGGYASYRRRMLRLGHISFFGIGFLNFLFAFTIARIPLPDLNTQVASIGFVVALIAMPSCCFLAAWKKTMRHLFPVAVVAVLVGIASLLLGWPPQ